MQRKDTQKTLAMMPKNQKWLSTRQDHARPYAFLVGVVEDRSVLMGLPEDPMGEVEH